MDHFFSYVNESNWLGIGGSYLIYAANVLDLAKQLTIRVTCHISEEPIPVVDKTDDIKSCVVLMDKIADKTVKLADLLALDVEINGHLINCQMVANGQKELADMLHAIEAEIDELEPNSWTADGTDPLTGYSKETASALVNSIDDDVLFAELLDEMNNAMYTEV